VIKKADVSAECTPGHATEVYQMQQPSNQGSVYQQSIHIVLSWFIRRGWVTRSSTIAERPRDASCN